jgi:hypothetical protein
MTDLEQCDHEIALATFALLTGCDAVHSHPVTADDALLYLFDWQQERAVLLAQDATTTMHRPQHLPILDAPEALRFVDRFWQNQPCSVCGQPGAECTHRAPALADFVALIRAANPAVAGSANPNGSATA